MALKFRPLNADLLKSIREQVKRCGSERHRATVVLLIEHARTGEFLLIESGKAGPRNPGLVKGGVERNESVLEALFREAKEEVGFEQAQVRVFGYGGSRSVRSMQKSKLVRKRYFFFHVVYDGPLELTIDLSEISGYQWLTIHQVREEIRVLLECRPDKYAVLEEAFETLANARTKAKRERVTDTVRKSKTKNKKMKKSVRAISTLKPGNIQAKRKKKKASS